jgi:hypothetical protein
MYNNPLSHHHYNHHYTTSQKSQSRPRHLDPAVRAAGATRGRSLTVVDLERWLGVDLRGWFVVLTISPGHSVRYLTKEVAQGRENYYTGAVAEGEPPGRWYGRGVEKLGLRGLVDEQDMTALYEYFIDPRDPAFNDPSNWAEASTLGHTGYNYPSEDRIYERLLNAEPGADAERRVQLRIEAGKAARKNVAFLDATFSVQKSVTILHAAFEWKENQARQAGDENAAGAWRDHRIAVEDAIWAGNNAMLDYLAEHAGYSRVGHHGGAGGRYTDAHDWTVASFFQHDNRDRQPQLHVHNAVLNRVEGPDGKWRTLDSKAVHKFRGAAATVGERTMEERISAALGIRFAARPDGKAREVVGVPQALNELFSSRTHAIAKHAAGLIEAFREKYDREPSPAERSRLEKRATFATRKAKSHTAETRAQFLERIRTETLAEVRGGLDEVARMVLDAAQQPPEIGRWHPSVVVDMALAELQASKAAWGPAELRRKISEKLPDRIGLTEGHDIGELIDTLTVYGLRRGAVRLDAATAETADVPDELRLADGRSAHEAPGAGLYATAEHVRSERALTLAATNCGAAAVDIATARRFVTELRELGLELGVDQAAAVEGVLTSGARLESLVGPAGTGKSYVVGALAKAWCEPQLWSGARRRVVGLASSQIATEVLAGEGVEARNVARWLGTQRRLAGGNGSTDDEQWRLRGGDLVVVDESAMADTADLTSIYHHAREASAKVLLVGDHRQLAAVGAGGGMELATAAGNAYELAEARRFTAEWEREASLRLREADESVLRTYHEHGRLIDAGAIEQAESSAARAWLGDTLNGKHSLLLVDSNAQAARLSATLRAELVRLGRVTEHGVPLSAQGTYAGLGDVVQARRNAWHLAGYDGNRNAPINRRRYKVLETHDDGGLTVATIVGHAPGSADLLGEQIHLPASYVAEHLTLGYACTYHAAQGTTVDTSHPVITPRTGAEALYVGMSRGREANTGHVTTRAVPEDAPTGQVNEAVHRNPAAVLATTLETAEPTKSATATEAEAEADAASIRTRIERLAADTELAITGRTVGWLDQLVDAGHLTTEQRERIAAEDGARTLQRLLRVAEIAGHAPQQVLTAAVAGRPLDGARRITNVIHSRITDANTLQPVGDSFTEWLPQLDGGPRGEQWQTYLKNLAADADARRDELATQTMADPPAWATLALGPVPDDPDERADWQRKAGLVAAHRELAGHDDPYEPLGAAPQAGQVEHYASWSAAWLALGRPEREREERQMSAGQLQARVHAYQREQNWAPKYVGNDLAATIQDAEHYRHTAALREAEAQAAGDQATRTQRQQEAANARAVAELRDREVAQLREAEQDRNRWLVQTSPTRAKAERAKAELANRNASLTPDEPDVTGEEWLTAHRHEETIEDTHRLVTEADIAPHDELDRLSAESPHGTPAAAEPVEAEAGLPETDVPDIRDIAATEPAVEEDAVRVPTVEEVTAILHRAQRALAETAQRETADAQRDAEHSRAAQLARWHADDRAAQEDAERETERHAETDWGIG